MKRLTFALERSHLRGGFRGRRWDDARYDAVNLRSAEEARATMARGQRATNSAQSEVDPAREGTNAS
jgi:hypothetical protein